MAIRTIALVVAICCTTLVRAAEDENPYKKLSNDQRIAAIRLAQVWTPIDTASLDLKSGPAGRGAFRFGETVTCTYLDKDSGGKTPKFWCAAAPGDEFKVKYGATNGEVYAEVAATRLLWALGFGSDAMYPVKVVCKGCTADPFRKNPKNHNGSHTFDPAVVERPAAGDEMSSNDHSGWAWVDLNSVDQTRGGAPLAHRDALKLLAVFMQHNDTKPEQQRLVCLDRVKESPARGDGPCAQPLMMLGDVGKTFGKANMMNKDNPGAVNLKAWAEADVWRGNEGCVGDMNQSFTGTLDRPVISEDGRKFLASLLSKLSDQQLRDLFEGAQFTRRDPSSTVDDWVRVFKQKRDEIANRHCANPAL